MTVADIDGARAVLRAGKPEDLLGLVECGWLDAKSGVYHLDDPAGAEELVKDVAGFANAKSGGLLLVGFSTKKLHGIEVLDQVRRVPMELVDLDRHRKLIRERVIPPPRDVDVDWIDRGGGKGILVIDVPTQSPTRVPHIVPGPTRSADVNRLSVVVPIREADATVWLPQGEVQRLLSAGWKAIGGPSEEFLRGLIEQAVSAARSHVLPPKPEFEIGEGEPGWKGPFQQSWNELMSQNVWIGLPASVLYRDGPGAVQHFESTSTLFGWVLCAIPHRRPVAVAGEVWQALRAGGAGVPGGDALGAVGFPVPEPQATRVIDAEATSVDLVGGHWGDGRLVRDVGSAEWRWEPAVRFSMNMTRAAGYWSSQPVSQRLRLRAIASLPWADADGLAIAGQRRSDLEQHLPISKLAGVVTTLSQRRGADLRAAQWNRGPNRNALDALSYSSVLTAPAGQVALAAEVMTALPTTMNSAVVTCAELRIEDLEAWAQAVAAVAGVPVRSDLRLSTEEVTAFLSAAWEMTTEMLPMILSEKTLAMNWADPPAVELRLAAESRIDSTPRPQPVLDDFIGMSPLGPSDRGQLREMSVTITAPPLLHTSIRQSKTRRALEYMAQQFGFLDATQDSW